MRVNVKNGFLRQTFSQHSEHYEVVGYDFEEDKIIVAQTNPVTQVARKNGKRYKLKYDDKIMMINIQLEGKEQLGKSSYNALYKSVSKAEVLDYLKGELE